MAILSLSAALLLASTALAVPQPQPQAKTCEKVSTLAGTQLTPAQIAFVAQKAGFTGDLCPNAVAVALAESVGFSNASLINTNCSKDRGLFQLSDTFQKVVEECALDVCCNAKGAFQISNHGADWTPWLSFPGNSNQHLDEATKACAAPQPFGACNANLDPGTLFKFFPQGELTCTQKYTVKAGDSCSALAEANKLHLADFNRMNPTLAPGNSCALNTIGQELCIDGTPAGGAKPQVTQIATTQQQQTTAAPATATVPSQQPPAHPTSAQVPPRVTQEQAYPTHPSGSAPAAPPSATTQGSPAQAPATTHQQAYPAAPASKGTECDEKDSKPAQTMPMPGQTMPAMPMPTGTMPMPAETMPVPGQTMPAMPMPTGTMPMPAETMPVPAQTMPVEQKQTPYPAQTPSGPAYPAQTPSGSSYPAGSPNAPASGSTFPGQNPTGQTSPSSPSATETSLPIFSGSTTTFTRSAGIAGLLGAVAGLLLL